MELLFGYLFAVKLLLKFLIHYILQFKIMSFADSNLAYNKNYTFQIVGFNVILRLIEHIA